MTELVVLEDEKFGEERAMVIAAADDVEFNVTVRLDDSTGLTAIAAVDAGPGDEVAAEAVALAPAWPKMSEVSRARAACDSAG